MRPRSSARPVKSMPRDRTQASRIRSIVNTGSGDHERGFGRHDGLLAADSLQPRVVPILCRTAGDRNARREIVDAEDTRCFAAAVCARPEPAGNWAEPAAERWGGEHLSEPRPDGRPGLAIAGRVRRCATREAAVSAAAV